MVICTRGRVSSGVPGFNKISEGGFKQGSINLVAGNPGSGKTTFAVQFLMDGLKYGEAGVYITFEENKKKLFDDFKAFGWDLERYERMGLLRFLEYTPEQIRRIVMEGGGTLESVITQLKVKRLVVDSVTSFSMLFGSELAKKESSLAFFELITKWGCTALLTGQAKQLSPDDLSSQLDFEVDSIVVLHHFKKKGIRERAIEIMKMRGTKIPEKTMRLILDKGGLKVDPSKVVSF
jgi:circadian clock protein KaiC